MADCKGHRSPLAAFPRGKNSKALRNLLGSEPRFLHHHSDAQDRGVAPLWAATDRGKTPNRDPFVLPRSFPPWAIRGSTVDARPTGRRRIAHFPASGSLPLACRALKNHEDQSEDG